MRTRLGLFVAVTPDAMSRVHPPKEHHQVAVEVQRRELARPEVGVVDSLFRHGMKNVASAKFVKELIDAFNSDAATGRSRNKGLGAGGNGPLAPVALPPAFVARLPQVQDGLVAPQDGETPVVMQHVEAEAVAIESDGGGRVSNRQGRDCLIESDGGSHQIGPVIKCYHDRGSCRGEEDPISPDSRRDLPDAL